jgi:hypothetical protein
VLLRCCWSAGGKKGVDMVGMSDLGGVKFFNLAVETPAGDMEVLEFVLEGERLAQGCGAGGWLGLQVPAAEGAVLGLQSRWRSGAAGGFWQPDAAQQPGERQIDGTWHSKAASVGRPVP